MNGKLTSLSIQWLCQKKKLFLELTKKLRLELTWPKTKKSFCVLFNSPKIWNISDFCQNYDLDDDRIFSITIFVL